MSSLFLNYRICKWKITTSTTFQIKTQWLSVLWQACSYSGMQLSWDTCVWCHLATAGIFKCPDEYIAPGPDCSNWTLSVLWHAQHTLMGHLTVLCIHPKKNSALCQRGPEAERERSADVALKIWKTKGHRFDGPPQTGVSCNCHWARYWAKSFSLVANYTSVLWIRATAANIFLKRIYLHLLSAGAGSLVVKETPSIFSKLSGRVHSSVTLNPCA